MESARKEGAGPAEQVLRSRVDRVDAACEVGAVVGQNGERQCQAGDEQGKGGGVQAPGTSARHGQTPGRGQSKAAALGKEPSRNLVLHISLSMGTCLDEEKTGLSPLVSRRTTPTVRLRSILPRGSPSTATT